MSYSLAAMQKRLQTYQVWLSADLKLADTILHARDKLLKELQNEGRFSKKLTASFAQTPPLVFNENDPKQVRVFKKTVNFLHDAADTLKKIEGMSLAELAKSSRSITHTLYEAVHMLNEIPSDLYEIIAPHINAVMPKLVEASKQTERFVRAQTTKVGSIDLSSLVNALPTPGDEKTGAHLISQQLVRLPEYFESLQRMISTDESATETQSQDYLAVMEKRAKHLEKELDSLIKHGQVLAIPSYLLTIKKLLTESSDILTTAAPLTKKSYEKAAESLNRIRHEFLPGIIAEVTALEETMALKPGSLTDPLLQKMKVYYETLAAQVEKIAIANKVISKKQKLVSHVSKSRLDKGTNSSDDSPDLSLRLSTLQDSGFKHALRLKHLKRYRHAKGAAVDKRKEHASSRFFSAIRDYVKGGRTLSELNSKEKSSLLKTYLTFRSHMLSTNEALDKDIMHILSPLDESKAVKAETVSAEKTALAVSRDTLSYAASFLPSIPYVGELVGSVTSGLKTAAKTAGFLFGLENNVLSQHGAVEKSIAQSMAQAEFETQLIQDSIDHHEIAFDRSTSQSPLEIRQCFESAIPYDNELETEDLATISQIKLKAQVQRLEIEGARNSLSTFLEILSTMELSPSAKIQDLTPGQKEILKHGYHKIQDFIDPNSNDFDTDMVNILNLIDNHSSPITVAELKEQLLLASENIDFHQKETADTLKKLDTQDLTTVEIDLKESARENPNFLKDKTLFATLKTLDASHKLKKLREKSVLPFLREHVDPTILRLFSIDSKDLPFTDLHKDPSEVQTYKNLINAFFLLERGFEQLEQLDAWGKSSFTHQQARFLSAFLKPLLGDITRGISKLSKTAKHPGLQHIVQHAFDILSPISTLPIIGDYIKTTPPEMPTKPMPDCFKQWQAQRALVEKTLDRKKTPSRKTATPAVAISGKSTPSDTTPIVQNTLQEVSQRLSAMVDTLRTRHATHHRDDLPTRTSFNERESLTTEQHIQSLIDSLSGSYLSLSGVQNILRSIDQLTMDVESSSQGARELLLAKLLSFRTDVGFQIIGLADDTEFELGLRPGTLSDPVTQAFEDFYVNFIDGLNLLNEKEKLALKTDFSITAIRLDRESDRLVQFSRRVEGNFEGQFPRTLAEESEDVYLDAVEDTRQLHFTYQGHAFYSSDEFTAALSTGFEQTRVYPDHIESNKCIFGAAHAYSPELNALFHALEKILSLPREDRTDFPLLTHQNDLLKLYQLLQPYLAKKGEPEQFLDDKLSSIISNDSLSNWQKHDALILELVEIRSLQPYVTHEEGAYNQLEDLSKKLTSDSVGFSLSGKPEDLDLTKVKQFLKCYETLQPFLALINPSKYSPAFYFRTLKTPHDFNTALTDLLAQKGALQEVVHAKHKGDLVKQNISANRKSYLREALIEQKHQARYEMLDFLDKHPRQKESSSAEIVLQNPSYIGIVLRYLSQVPVIKQVISFFSSILSFMTKSKQINASPIQNSGDIEAGDIGADDVEADDLETESSYRTMQERMPADKSVEHTPIKHKVSQANQVPDGGVKEHVHTVDDAPEFQPDEDRAKEESYSTRHR